MKNFQELKIRRLEQEKEKIDIETQLLDNNPGYDTRKNIQEKLKIRKRVVENIDEVIQTQIAYHINNLYEGMRLNLQKTHFLELFYKDFELYIIRIANVTITKDKKFKSKGYYGYSPDILKAIIFFDFTLEELQNLIQNLIDKKFNSNTRDELIISINEQYGTNIPLIIELETAKRRVFESWFNEKNKLINNKNYKLLRAKNGEFMKNDEYPLYYQLSIIEYYDKIIESYNEHVKSKTEKQEENTSTLVKKRIIS